MNPRIPRKNNPTVEQIARRSSLWGATASIAIIAIFALVTIMEEHRAHFYSELRRMDTIKTLIARSLAAEILIGDPKSVSMLQDELKRRYELGDLRIVENPIPQTDRVNWLQDLFPPTTAARTEVLPGITPNQFLLIAADSSLDSVPKNAISLLYLVLPLLFFGIITTLRIQKELRRSIALPLQNLAKDPQAWKADGDYIAEEALVLHDRLTQFMRERDAERDKFEALRIEASIGQVAAQVAHDIRSPLAALDMVAGHLTSIPEEKRVIIRGALSRIRDIANGLLEKHRSGLKKQAVRDNEGAPVSIQAAEEPANQLELISSLIDSLITEKRMQFRTRWDVQIEAPLSTNAYGLFSAVDGPEFQRVLSNLINNAVEAVGLKGRVTVEMDSSPDQVIVRVRDDGRGIPQDVLPKLMQRGETHGKSTGVGLGLYHAKRKIEDWKGTIQIESKQTGGTVIEIRLPRSPVPEWFVPELALDENCFVVVLDDDSSIHQIWQGRFDSLRIRERGVEIVHMGTYDELLAWRSTHRVAEEKLVYLVDYELVGSPKNGLEIISDLRLQKNAYLVTSRFEEKSIRQSCARQKVRLIPKSLAGFVPIRVVSTPSRRVAGLEPTRQGQISRL